MRPYISVFLYVFFCSINCFSFDGKIDIFLESDVIYPIVKILNNYSLDKNIRLYIDVSAVNTNNFSKILSYKKDIFVLSNSRVVESLQENYEIKSLGIDRLVLVAHNDNFLINSEFIDMNIEEKINQIFRNGFMVIGEESGNYGVACRSILEELGVYKQFYDRLIRTSDANEALIAVIKGKGFGLLPLGLVNSVNNLTIVGDLSDIKSSVLFFYILYLKKVDDLVNFIISNANK